MVVKDQKFIIQNVAKKLFEGREFLDQNFSLENGNWDKVLKVLLKMKY